MDLTPKLVSTCERAIDFAISVCNSHSLLLPLISCSIRNVPSIQSEIAYSQIVTLGYTVCVSQ